MNKKIYENALKKINNQCKPNCIIGPTGPRGLIGPTGPKGEKGDLNISEAYIVTFNDGNIIPVLSNNRLPLRRIEININDIVSIDNDYIKFNKIGYYKVSFIVSSSTEKTDTSSTDFVSLGLRLINTDNIYIGASKWIYNNEFSQITSQGIISIYDINNLYELVNVSPKTIYLNSPDLNDIKSDSYFTNWLVNVKIAYLGRGI